MNWFDLVGVPNDVGETNDYDDDDDVQGGQMTAKADKL